MSENNKAEARMFNLLKTLPEGLIKSFNVK